jgi:hypothetical protein
MTSRANLKFGFDAFDSSIQVECANSAIYEILQRYIFPSIPRRAISRSAIPRSAIATGNFGRTQPDIRLCVDDNEDGFRILLNDQYTASAGSLQHAALAAVKALDDSIVHRMKTFRAVHAGAVFVEGRALLIPGSSHAGKSSLVAELLRRGASHFSDEYALIDNAGLVHSYPRPLLLRAGGPMQSLVLPQELNASFATEPAPVGWVVALEYVPGGAWSIRPISQGEGVMLLLRHTPHEMDQAPEMLDFFLRVASNAICFTGQRGEASDAATRIIDLIRQN